MLADLCLFITVTDLRSGSVTRVLTTLNVVPYDMLLCHLHCVYFTHVTVNSGTAAAICCSLMSQ